MKKLIPLLTIILLLSACNNTSTTYNEEITDNETSTTIISNKLTENKSFYEQKVIDRINYQINDYYDLKQVFFKLDKNKEYYVFRYDMTTMRDIYFFVGKVNDEELKYYYASVYLYGF